MRPSGRGTGRPDRRAGGLGHMAHLDEIKERIGNIGQIEGVIVAMRAMAAAHAQEARRHLRAIRQHEDTVARAMADAMALVAGGRTRTGAATRAGHSFADRRRRRAGLFRPL